MRGQYSHKTALARNKDGKMAIDYAKKNKMLVGTKAYLDLRNKSLE